MMITERVVIWFSCGVTSAIAAKIAIDKYKDRYPVVLAAIDTGSEDDDNWRFAADVSAWLDYPITILKSDKYVDTFDVYDKRRFIVGPHGAPCSFELKKRVREKFQDLWGDLQVFGYDSAEQERYDTFLANNPLIKSEAPLLDHNLSKVDCQQLLAEAGIKQPMTYDLGFKNANCLKRGCVKGGMGYWNHYRKVYPDRFDAMARKEREIGAAICKKYVDGVRVRVFLDELDPNAGNYNAEPAFQCGLFCALPEV